MDLLKGYPWPGNVRELENLVRRLAALYAEDSIGADVVRAELEEANVGVAQEASGGADSFGESVERHLSQYFAAHEDGLPPSGLYGRVIKEVERPPHRDVPECDSRKPSPGSSVAGSQQKHLAKEDY